MLSKIIIFVFFVFSSTLKTESQNITSYIYNGMDIPVGQVHFHLSMIERKTWINALEHCWSHGMNLASITTQDENDKLEEAIQHLQNKPDINFLDEPFWTSGADFPGEKESPRKFFWMSTGLPFTFVNWANAKQPIYNDEPNNINGNEHCVEATKIDNKLTWNVNYCYVRRFFICEVRDVVI